MKTLVETSSALYAKRIVREINQIRGAGKSVYVSLPGSNIRVKTFKFGVGGGLDGATILLSDGGRYAKINLERMVDEAIKAGWLDEKLDFKTI